jgi:DNA-binding MarR family transcriptional regulator
MSSKRIKLEESQVKQKRLTKDEIDLFDRLYYKGVKRKEIARILEISESGVKQRITRLKMANRRVNFTNEMIDQMFSLWQDRLTVGQIAIKMDLDKHRVHYQLKKMCLVD